MSLRYYEPRQRHGDGGGRRGSNKPAIKFSTMSMVINLAARRLLPENVERVRMGFDPDDNSLHVVPTAEGGSVLRKSKVHAAGMLRTWGLKWLSGQRIPVRLIDGVLVGYPAPPEEDEEDNPEANPDAEGDQADEDGQDDEDDVVARRYGGMVINRSA